MLRWAGTGIGILLPLMTLIVAEAGRQGWTVFGSVSSYSAADIIGDAVPLLLTMAVWPLMALLVTSQVFCADRTGGTEAFLLERPVRRSTIWRARVLAALGTVAAICVGQFVIWWLMAQAVGATSTLDPGRELQIFLGVGGTLTAIATIAGGVAGCLARSPIQALLLSLVFGTLPLGAGALFGGVFSGASIGGFRLGYALPILILIAYVVASFSMSCRGEPAGRGRAFRGLGWVAAGLVAVPLTFAATAPGLMRLDARLSVGNSYVVAAPGGGTAMIVNDRQGSAWLVDLASRDVLRFFPPPVISAAWNADGSRLAVLHSGSALGRQRGSGRVEILDPRGKTAGPTFQHEDLTRGITKLVWSGDRVLVESVLPASGIHVLDTATGSRSRADLDWLPWTWFILDPIEGEEVFVLHRKKAKVLIAGSDRGVRSEFGVLRRFDAGSRKFGPEIPVHLSGGLLYDSWRALSPSGRYWFSMKGEPRGQGQVQDLADGSMLDVDLGHGFWMAGDVLVTSWRGRISVGPLGAQEVLIDNPGTYWFPVISPDRNRLLVDVRPGRDSEAERTLWVYDRRTGSLDELPFPELPGGPDDEYRWAQWAGDDTLLWIGGGLIATQELGTGALHEVIGSPF